jgi:lipopolysaccharide export system protein LptA
MKKAILICVAHFFSTPNTGWGQTKIQIIRSDTTDFIKGDNGAQTYYLKGNVALRQDVALMYCDSAVLYRPQNTFEAFGNIRVIQDDTVLITGEELTYEGDKRTFTITDNVVLKTPSSKLATKVLKYDRNTSTAYYLTRSTLERKELRITSDVGNYNTEYEVVRLRGNIIAVDSAFKMTTDTLLYSPKKNKYSFAGPTELIRDSTKLFCSRGTYSADSTLLELYDGAKMMAPKQYIEADSLYYFLNSEDGTLHGNAMVADSVEGFVLNSSFIDYKKSPVYVDAYQPVFYKQSMDNDTIYAKGDRLAIRSELDSNKIVHLYGETSFFSSDFQGISPNFLYQEGAEELALYPYPTLWSGNSEFGADSTALKLKADELDSLFMLNNVTITTATKDSSYFDQTTGTKLKGNFLDNALKTVRIDGNAQALLHNVSEEGSIEGLNKSSCSWMKIVFQEDALKRIRMARDVEATYTPKKSAVPEWLPGCQPAFELRPNKSSLTLPVTPAPEQP